MISTNIIRAKLIFKPNFVISNIFPKSIIVHNITNADAIVEGTVDDVNEFAINSDYILRWMAIAMIPDTVTEGNWKPIVKISKSRCG